MLATPQPGEEENLTMGSGGGGGGGSGGGRTSVDAAHLMMPTAKRARPCRLQLEFPCPAAQMTQCQQPPAAAIGSAAGSPLSPISANPSVLVQGVGQRKRQRKGNGNGLHDFHSAVAIGRSQQQQQQQQQQQEQLYSECDGAGGLETAQLPNVGPTQVLPHLYIGSQADSLDADVMRQFGITHVINVSVACPQSQHVPDANFLRIPVNDGYTDKLLPHFQRAFNFLERVRETSGRCLVHCLAGISRSPTLSIAYTMMHCRMSQEEAYRFVKQRRQHISPNFNFLGQLLEFERQLRRAAAAETAAAAGAPLAASEERPEAKRQRTANGRSPSGALSQLTFASASVAAAAAAAAAASATSEVSRRPRSVLLVSGAAPDQLSASVRRSRSSDAFLAATIEADEGPVACLS